MLKQILNLNLRLLTHGLVLYPHGNSLDQIEPIVDVLDAYNMAIERYKTLNTQISEVKNETNKLNDSLSEKNKKLETEKAELLVALKEIVKCETNRREDLRALSMKPKSLYSFSDERVRKAHIAIANAEGKPYKPSLHLQM